MNYFLNRKSLLEMSRYMRKRHELRIEQLNGVVSRIKETESVGISTFKAIGDKLEIIQIIASKNPFRSFFNH